MFGNQPNIKKMTQVSEQSSTPVQIPIWVGQDCIVMQQQDFRKIEDTRLVTYSKLTKEGNLLPIDSNNESNSHILTMIESAVKNCNYGTMSLTPNGLTATQTSTPTSPIQQQLPFQQQQYEAVNLMAQQMDTCSCTPDNSLNQEEKPNSFDQGATSTVMVIHRQLVGGSNKYTPQVRVCRGNNTEPLTCANTCANEPIIETGPDARELIKRQKQKEDIWGGC